MPAMSAGRVVVVGAGPCGLSCARELLNLGHSDVVVLEANSVPGGLARSVVDPAGFTWDLGGHVVFSHYGEFDRLLSETLGDEVIEHDRSSYLRIAGTWVPYPIQNNLHRLPAVLAGEALVGVIESATGGPQATDNFANWVVATFGEPLAELFMRPYNEKVWAHPLDQMSSDWIAERVATPDWRAMVHGMAAGTDDLGWGPNSRFRFPLHGGTGAIYQRLAERLGAVVSYDRRVTSADHRRRVVHTSDGAEGFDSLVWTGPLDRLVQTMTDAPAEVTAAAGELRHNEVTMVGIGYEEPLNDDRSWLYFPEAGVPFYRATNFAKYSPNNVPDGDTSRYSSWMTETASSPWRPPPDGGHNALAGEVDRALRHEGLVHHGSAIASIHVEHIDYAYPIPTRTRDAALGVIQPWLEANGIFSRGRFGAWRYELGNMDHAVKMGVDLANRLVNGRAEEAYRS